jgi:hypothetical protein
MTNSGCLSITRDGGLVLVCEQIEPPFFIAYWTEAFIIRAARVGSGAVRLGPGRDVPPLFKFVHFLNDYG